ncbi:hypothetical protein CR513_28488, partial [Mucuna pruriens]
MSLPDHNEYLNFGDLVPTRKIIQLPNKSIVQPLGILEDVLVQVNELIFPTDFYVLDMEGEAFGKGSTLILGRTFFMIAWTNIEVHARTLLMEFKDNLVQFNIFEAMKHPTEGPGVVNSTSSHSPFELVFGFNLLSPLDFLLLPIIPSWLNDEGLSKF